jgi:hypothetical protein
MRYYLHLDHPEGVAIDEEGCEFSDLEAARAEARASIQEMLGDHIARGKLTSRMHIDITDERGATLDRVALAITVS